MNEAGDPAIDGPRTVRCIDRGRDLRTRRPRAAASGCRVSADPVRQGAQQEAARSPALRLNPFSVRGEVKRTAFGSRFHILCWSRNDDQAVRVRAHPG